MSLKILSANCQGLGGINKRRDVLNHFKREKCMYDIYCLQDTHFTSKMQKDVKKMWHGKCFFSFFSSHSRGVAILFNKKFVGTVSREKTDPGGNYLMLELTVRGKNFLLCSLYGPNKDTPVFYETLQANIESFNCERVIICGDFNLVLNPELDYFNYKRTNNCKARQKVLKLIEDNDFVDIFRENNPDAKEYTWRKARPLKQSRLDFFLMSENLLSWFPNSVIESSCQSDHSMIALSLKFNDFKKGEGCWKFDNSLLKDGTFLKLINKVIKDYKKQYADKQKELQVGGDEKINDQSILEELLNKIRCNSLSYKWSKKKENSKKNLESPHEKRWLEEEESRNVFSRTIPRIKLQNGKFIYKQSSILKKIKESCEQLYRNGDDSVEDCNLQEYLPFSDIKKLSKQESRSLNGHITLEEAKETLDRMKSNDSPGSDGFTSEFFKVFWKDIGNFVVRSINYGYDHKMLSQTQRHGIITCLLKEHKGKHCFENCRPITQLNTVYKIASGTIAYRIKKYIQKIIHPDQTAFLLGRKGAENVRLIYDIMQYTEEKNIPGLLVLVDFKKAFDSLSWSFIEKSLKFFKFGDSITRWVRLFYSNVTSAVNQGGNISETFFLHRGCRQGDPLSPYLFSICAEILAIKIRKSKDIKGINFLESEKKISMFADETSLILDGTKKSLWSSLSILRKFAKISGIHINFNKTQVVWIGGKKSSNAKICEKEALIWGSKTFKIFGIEFNTQLNEIFNMNFSLKLNVIKKEMRHQKHRDLTCLDRFTVLKTHLLPTLNDIFATLPNPSDSQLKDLESDFYSFVGSFEEIHDDGIKMISMKEFIMAEKLVWMKNIIQQSSKLNLILDLDIKKIVLCGDKYIQDKIKKVKNMFWRDVLKAWLFFCAKARNINPCTSMEPLFFNNNILVHKKTIFHQKWFKNNVCFVNDVLKVDGSFMKLKDFKLEYGIRLQTRTYERLIAAIKEWLKNNSNNNISLPKLCMPYIPQKVFFLLNAKESSDFYEILNN